MRHQCTAIAPAGQAIAPAGQGIGRATEDRAPLRFETERLEEALLAHLPTIHSTAVVMAEDAAQVEELVVLTFERGSRDLALVEDLSNVRIRMLRFLTENLRSLGEEWDDEARSPITSLEATSCAELSEALRSLPPFVRLPLWLSDGEGLSHGETADVLGTSIDSVREALHLVRRTLRGVLSERARGERWDG